MKRNLELLKRRKEFIMNYFKDNSKKLTSIVINELQEILFISEKTIYNIISEESDEYGRKKAKENVKQCKPMETIIIVNVNELLQKIEACEKKLKEVASSKLSPGEKEQHVIYFQTKIKSYNERLKKLIKNNNALLNISEDNCKEVKTKVFDFKDEDDTNGFMIKAKDAFDAYDLAQKQFGPYVNNMICKQRT